MDGTFTSSPAFDDVVNVTFSTSPSFDNYIDAILTNSTCSDEMDGILFIS